jgi:hypothetical protein
MSCFLFMFTNFAYTSSRFNLRNFSRSRTPNEQTNQIVRGIVSMHGSYPYILLVLSLWTITAISHVTSSYQRDRPLGSDIRPEDAIKARWAKRRKSSRKSEKPNIVIVLTDDQDIELGKFALGKFKFNLSFVR